MQRSLLQDTSKLLQEGKEEVAVRGLIIAKYN